MIWKQTLNMFQSYNEFLNGLLGYLILCWQIINSKPLNTNLVQSNYGVKVQHFKKLTNSEDGIFYLYHRISRPDLRNAIAHSSIWLDDETSEIYYAEGKGKRKKTINVTDFFSLSFFGSYIAGAYTIALSSVIVWMSGNKKYQLQLPKDIIKFFTNELGSFSK